MRGLAARRDAGQVVRPDRKFIDSGVNRLRFTPLSMNSTAHIQHTTSLRLAGRVSNPPLRRPTKLQLHTLASALAFSANTCFRPITKKPNVSVELRKVNSGGYLLSHLVTKAVPSAPIGLTSVFGMGTGVTLSPTPPENLNLYASYNRDYRKRKQHSLIAVYQVLEHSRPNMK